MESGSRPKGGINKDLKEGIPSIGAESIEGLGFYDFQKEKLVTEDFFRKLRKGILKDKDILIYKDGAYIGKTTLFQDNFPYHNCAVNEHVFLVHTKKPDLQYLLYFTLHSKTYYKRHNL